MSDRDALYAAILAHPDEDTPRLAYADWLDEHGTAKDKKHAEFIRAQCELARLDAEDPSARLAAIGLRYIDWKKYDVTLARRIQLDSLTSKLHMSLRKSLQTGLEQWDESFNRGFGCSYLFNDGNDFAENAPALCAVAPLQYARFRQLTPKDAKLVAKSPALAQIRHLTVFGSLSADTVKALASTDSIRGVEAVDIDEPTTDAITALVESERWKGLTDIRVEALTSTDRVFRALAGSPLREQLKSLWLTNSDVTSTGLRAIAKVAWPNLRVLYLWGSRIDDRGALALAASKGFPRLSSLDLTSSVVTGAGVGALLSAANLSELREVQTSSEALTGFEADNIGPNPAPSLRTVNLTSNQNLDGGRVGPLFDLLSRSAVARLDLSWLQLGANGMKALAKTTGWKNLRAVSLSYCELNESAAVALAGWSGLAGVERLAMEKPNPIGQRGADAIAKSPHLGKIKQIIMPTITPALTKRFGSKLSTRDRMYS